MLRIVGSTLSLVGSGRRSIVPATNGSQSVGGCNPVLTRSPPIICTPKTEPKVTVICTPQIEPKVAKKLKRKSWIPTQICFMITTKSSNILKYRKIEIQVHVHLWSFSCIRHTKPHFQCNANREVATTSPRFCNETHPLHVIFVDVVLGTTFTSCLKHHFVVIKKAEQQVRKASHCGTKQQWRSHVVLILFLLVRATWVLFFTHIPFVANRTFTTTLRGCNSCSKVGLDFLKWLRVKETSKMQTDKIQI